MMKDGQISEEMISAEELESVNGGSRGMDRTLVELESSFDDAWDKLSRKYKKTPNVFQRVTWHSRWMEQNYQPDAETFLTKFFERNY